MTAPPFRPLDLAPLLDALTAFVGRPPQRGDGGDSRPPAAGPTEEDAYVRRWRPTFGYAVALSWLVTMLAVAWVVVRDPAQAPAVIAALLDTAPIWGGALAVLGLSVVKRSQDKRGATPPAQPTPTAPPPDPGTGAPPPG